MTAAFEPEAGHAVGDAEVLHTASMRAQVWPDPVECALNPGVDVQRMQAMQ